GLCRARPRPLEPWHVREMGVRLWGRRRRRVSRLRHAALRAASGRLLRPHRPPRQHPAGRADLGRLPDADRYRRYMAGRL
ncbi:MAG: hypothetical protein AVDCRST_MAG68-4896, partial [uncultured Gemmatimonadetes bacterium]